MNIELVTLTSADGDITDLKKMHNTPSVAKYISISDSYFDYVTSSAGVVYYKIVVEDILTGGIHCEIDGEIMYLSICIKDEYRRRGFAEAALRKLFLSLPDDVKMIEANIDETNISSLLLFQKLGFTQNNKEEELITYRLTICR